MFDTCSGAPFRTKCVLRGYCTTHSCPPRRCGGKHFPITWPNSFCTPIQWSTSMHHALSLINVETMKKWPCQIVACTKDIYSWAALFLRPKGKWLSLAHQRYITGRELFALMGFPIHRLRLEVVDDSVAWLVYPHSCMTTMDMFQFFPNDHLFGQPRFCTTWQGTAWVSEWLQLCWLLLSLQPGLTKWPSTKEQWGSKMASNCSLSGMRVSSNLCPIVYKSPFCWFLRYCAAMLWSLGLLAMWTDLNNH